MMHIIAVEVVVVQSVTLIAIEKVCAITALLVGIPVAAEDTSGKLKMLVSLFVAFAVIITAVV